LNDLEKILENPNDPERVRFLDGADESPALIMKKLEQVNCFLFKQLCKTFY
jgi:hypothetical protein